MSYQKQTAERTLHYFKGQSKWFMSYALLDKNGTVLLDTDTFNVGLSKTDQLFFQIPFQRTRTYLSPVQEKSEGKEEGEGESLFYLGAPVYGRFGKEPIGVLRVQYNANILQTLIVDQNNLLGEGSFAALLNINYAYLAHGIHPEKRYQPISSDDVDLINHPKNGLEIGIFSTSGCFSGWREGP